MDIDILSITPIFTNKTKSTIIINEHRYEHYYSIIYHDHVQICTNVMTTRTKEDIKSINIRTEFCII